MKYIIKDTVFSKALQIHRYTILMHVDFHNWLYIILKDYSFGMLRVLVAHVEMWLKTSQQIL